MVVYLKTQFFGLVLQFVMVLSHGVVPTFAFVNRILGVATHVAKLSCGTVWNGGGASTVEVIDDSYDYIN